MKKLAVIMVVLVTGFAAACGNNGDDSGGNASGPDLSGAVGPGISVNEAISSDLSGPLLINGFLVIQGGEHDSPEEVRLCEALAESFPPQCGGAFLIIEGLDVKGIEGLVSEGPVSWTDQYQQVLGTVDGDTVTVTETAR